MPRASRSRKVERETCRLGAAVRKKSSPVAQPREISRIIHNTLYRCIFLYYARRTIFSWRIYKCDRKCRGKSVLFFVCDDIHFVGIVARRFIRILRNRVCYFFRLLQYACGFYSYSYSYFFFYGMCNEKK